MRFIHPQTELARITRFLGISVAFLGILVIGATVEFVIVSGHTRSLNESVRQMLASESANQVAMKQAQAIAKRSYPVGFACVDAFRSSLDAAADNHHVEVAELRSSTDVVPFLTKFEKDQTDPAWQQIAVHLNLHGRLADVMACLQDLRTSDAVYELQAVDLGRFKVTRESTIVSAGIDLEVLTRTKAVGS